MDGWAGMDDEAGRYDSLDSTDLLAFVVAVVAGRVVSREYRSYTCTANPLTN